MHFGENQLSRCLIGLSPLTTGHPPSFQPRWVRPSTRSYPRFSLPMARSHRFGSRTSNFYALFRLAFATAPRHRLTSLLTTNSPAHSSKGTPSPPQRRLRRIVGTRFQVLFHSPPGVLFTIPSRYYPLSVVGEYLALWGGPHGFTRNFTGSALLGNTGKGGTSGFAYGTVTLSGRPFHTDSATRELCNSPTRRQTGPPGPTTPPWQRLPALPPRGFGLRPVRSPLLGASLLFSSPRGTEMFQFPRFPYAPYVFRHARHGMTRARFTHSDIRGSTLAWQLPAAYRSLQRPSSASNAKASTVCP
jgi:hypothetical protein